MYRPELMTEEVTNGSPWAPDVRTMGFISKAAFEIGDYWRIVEVLHIRFNWGLAVRNKSERIVKFLDERQLLTEERHRARKLSHEIRGFGSFVHRSSNSATQSCGEIGDGSFERCNYELNGYGAQEESVSSSTDSCFTESNKSGSSSEFSTDSESPPSSAKSYEVISMLVNEQTDESNSMAKIKGSPINLNKNEELVSSKDLTPDEHDDDWDPKQESRPLLGVQKEEIIIFSDCSLCARNSHPFDQLEAQSRDNLLSAGMQ